MHQIYFFRTFVWSTPSAILLEDWKETNFKFDEHSIDFCFLPFFTINVQAMRFAINISSHAALYFSAFRNEGEIMDNPCANAMRMKITVKGGRRDHSHVKSTTAKVHPSTTKTPTTTHSTTTTSTTSKAKTTTTTLATSKKISISSPQKQRKMWRQILTLVWSYEPAVINSEVTFLRKKLLDFFIRNIYIFYTFLNRFVFSKLFHTLKNIFRYFYQYFQNFFFGFPCDFAKSEMYFLAFVFKSYTTAAKICYFWIFKNIFSNDIIL